MRHRQDSAIGLEYRAWNNDLAACENEEGDVITGRVEQVQWQGGHL